MVKKNKITETWKTVIKLVRQHKWIFMLFIVICLMGIPLGYFLPDNVQKEGLSDYENSLNEDGLINNPDSFSVFFGIFLRNALSAFLVIALPIVLFLPSLSLFFGIINGAMIGIMFNEYYTTFNAGSVINYIIYILPHGFIEVPTIILAAYLGFLIGFKLIFRNKLVSDRSFKELLSDTLFIYLFLILPLLLIAALIEAYITPMIISFFV